MATGAAIGIGALGLYQGYQQGKKADKALGNQADAARSQAEISQQQVDLAKEQWNLYKDNIYPLEQKAQQLGLDYKEIAMQQYKDYYKPLGDQFAQEAMDGVKAQPERAARDARLQVDSQFNTEEGMQQRNLQRRGVRPGAGNYDSGIADTSLNRAASKAFTVNRAIEGERDRVEDVNFNRKAVALGRTPTVTGSAPGLSSGAGAAGLAYAGQTAGSAGRNFGNIANTYGNAAGGIASGGIQLGMQAYDLYNKYKTPALPAAGSVMPGTTSYAPNPGAVSTTNMGPTTPGFAFAEGGQVDVPPSLGRGGQVNGPAGNDQVPAYVQAPDGSTAPARLTDGEFVIPKDVVAAVGTDTLDDIIESARSRKQKALESPNALTRRAS